MHETDRRLEDPVPADAATAEAVDHLQLQDTLFNALEQHHRRGIR